MTRFVHTSLLILLAGSLNAYYDPFHDMLVELEHSHHMFMEFNRLAAQQLQDLERHVAKRQLVGFKDAAKEAPIISIEIEPAAVKLSIHVAEGKSKELSINAADDNTLDAKIEVDEDADKNIKAGTISIQIRHGRLVFARHHIEKKEGTKISGAEQERQFVYTNQEIVELPREIRLASLQNTSAHFDANSSTLVISLPRVQGKQIEINRVSTIAAETKISGAPAQKPVESPVK